MTGPRTTPGRKSRPPRGGRVEPVSKFTTARLSVYLRCLEILEAEDIRTVSSKDLAERFGLNSAQIRKDIATFGEFGVRGVGYDVSALKTTILGILGLDRRRSLVIIGAGHLGLALADYDGFNSAPFEIVALFDVDPSKIGRRTRGGIPVLSIDRLESVLQEEQVEIGVVAVPAEVAQQTYDRLADAGIRAILNFSPQRIRLRPEVKIRSVDLKISLESLAFHLAGATSSVAD